MSALVIVFEINEKLLQASLELFSAARILTDEITAVYVGKDEKGVNETARYCKRLFQVSQEEHAESQQLVSVIAQIVKKVNADYILLPGTAAGRELTGRIAARLEGVGFDRVTGIECRDKETIFTRPVYSGMVYEHIRSGRSPVIFSAKEGSFAVPEPESGIGIIEKYAVSEEVQRNIAWIKNVTEIAQNADLEGADIVVAGGRGVGDQDGFRLVEELAETLGGVTGATRMAIDNGWVDRTHQIGQSGKTVSPKVYIACGISGAVQHTCGISDQSFLIAVNKDEEAPIFKIADVGIVGDVKKILPEMIREVKEWKQERARE